MSSSPNSPDSPLLVRCLSSRLPNLRRRALRPQIHLPLDKSRQSLSIERGSCHGTRCGTSGRVLQEEQARIRHDSDSSSKPVKNLNGHICQICGDTVGLTATS
ncbi:hypothetical protein EV1_000165 [Malus domestica]